MNPATQSKADLIETIKMLDEQLQAYENNKLGLYRPHDGRGGFDESTKTGQIGFHKSSKQIRLLVAGNRCLREDQKIITKNGLKAIGDIAGMCEEVLSFDQRSNQFVWNRAIYPFAKGRSHQYRVVHEAGEFVADGRHRIFSVQGKYEYVRDLQCGDLCFVCPHDSISALGQRSYFSNELHLRGTGEGCVGGYRVCNYLYDRQLPFLLEAYRLFLKRYNDAITFVSFVYCVIFLLVGIEGIQKLKHSHPCQWKSLFEIEDDVRLFLGQFLTALEDRAFYGLLQRIYEGNGSSLQFLWSLIQDGKVELFDSSSQCKVLCVSSYNSSYTISRIKSIEKLTKEEWYWDMTVENVHNYVTSDGIIHSNSGKSEASTIEAIWLSLGIHPYHKIPVPNKGKLYGDTFPIVTLETFGPKFEKWLPKSALDSAKPYMKSAQGYLSGINFANGSRITFGAYQQEAGTAEGGDADFVCFDEPPPRNIYIANLRSIVDRGGLMWFSMTPLREAWIYDELWLPGVHGQKEYIDCFNWSSYDNPYVNKKTLDILAAECTPQEREVRIEGLFKKLQGVVIDSYRPEFSDIDEFELTSDFVIFEGLDPHESKPNAALWKALDRNNFRYSCAELDFDGGIYDFGQELAKVRRRLTAGGATLIKSVSDTSVNVEDWQFKINMRDELNRSLRDAGEVVMPVMAVKKGWLLPGIKKLRDLFKPIVQASESDRVMPTEYLFRHSVPKYRYELLHYQWPENISSSEVRPIPKYNERIDCSRYIESIAPKFITPGEQNFITRTYNGAYRREIQL